MTQHTLEPFSGTDFATYEHRDRLIGNNAQIHQNFGNGMINIDSQGSLLDITKLNQTEMVRNDMQSSGLPVANTTQDENTSSSAVAQQAYSNQVA